MSIEDALADGRPLLGLSLSFCIRDIIEGAVPLERVAGIRSFVDPRWTGTIQQGWDYIIRGYRENYWQADPDRAEDIVRDMIQKEMIILPRVTGGEQSIGWSIVKGHWTVL